MPIVFLKKDFLKWIGTPYAKAFNKQLGTPQERAKEKA